jgi:hypothetical protein
MSTSTDGRSSSAAARRSFVATYDGRQVAVHRGQTRVAEGHELAIRFPLRFEKVDRARMRGHASATSSTPPTYDEYVRMLDKATARLGVVEQRGAVRVTAP